MPKKTITKSKNYLRVRLYFGEIPIKRYSYQDIGRKGHAQRLSIQLKNGRWVTYGYIFKLSDIRNRDPTTLSMLKKLRIKYKNK